MAEHSSVPASDIRVGTCAWSFTDWKGSFYPDGLPASQRLAYYAKHFRALEIDSTFYAAPSEESAAIWHDSTPDDFLFTCKLPREITHVRKLRNCEAQVEEFLAQMAPLQEKLACVLVQLPSYFTLRHDENALREFVRHLPSGVRWAVELRDPGWNLPRVAHFLTEHQIAWVWNDVTSLEQQDEAAFGYRPCTSDLLYLRLLGDLGTKFTQDGGQRHVYDKLLWERTASLESWALRVRQHPGETCRTLIFANNHFEGFAPLTAKRIADLLGVGGAIGSETMESASHAERQLVLALE